METISIRSVSTRDVKIAQAGLEKIGFKTIKEFDCPEAYIVDMSVPEEYTKMKFAVKISDPFREDKTIKIIV